MVAAHVQWSIHPKYANALIDRDVEEGLNWIQELINWTTYLRNNPHLRHYIPIATQITGGINNDLSDEIQYTSHAMAQAGFDAIETMTGIKMGVIYSPCVGTEFINKDSTQWMCHLPHDGTTVRLADRWPEADAFVFKRGKNMPLRTNTASWTSHNTTTSSSYLRPPHKNHPTSVTSPTLAYQVLTKTNLARPLCPGGTIRKQVRTTEGEDGSSRAKEEKGPSSQLPP